MRSGLKRFSTADINKELSILDKHDIVKHKIESAKEAAAKKAQSSRDAQAEKYLEALKKKDPSAMQAKRAVDKPVPVSSRKNPAYVDAQKMRDLEAKVDMKMLKKGAVIVEEHNKVKAIKLQPVVVHGDDKLAKEREMVEKAKEAAKAGSHERSLIADKDLKKLRQQPALGKPFHKVIVPKSVLDHRKSHMNEKAMRDLKALMSEEHAERAHKVKMSYPSESQGTVEFLLWGSGKAGNAGRCIRAVSCSSQNPGNAGRNIQAVSCCSATL